MLICLQPCFQVLCLSRSCAITLHNFHSYHSREIKKKENPVPSGRYEERILFHFGLERKMWVLLICFVNRVVKRFKILKIAFIHSEPLNQSNNFIYTRQVMRAMY